MIHGLITADREAVIHLIIRDINGQEEDIEAVIDTGFNDYLTLPKSLVSRLALPFAAPTQATLADGSTIRLDCYQATIIWNEQPRTILALEAEGGSLIGMSLLYGHLLTLEVVDGGNVVISSLT